MESYEHNLPLFFEAMQHQEKEAKILGVHLEGPFINPIEGYRGIHRKEYIISPLIGTFKKLQNWSHDSIVLLTLAPEIPGALDLIKEVVRNKKIVVSIGHSNASGEIIKKAVKAGVKAATHVGNGLPDLIQRHDNPIWSILAEDDLFGLFITDGFHLPEEVIKTCLRTKKTSKFIATSDLMHLGGKNPGMYKINDIPVVLERNGHLHIQNSSQLAGSASSMMECMNYLASVGELSLEELIQIGYENPLNLLHAEINREKIKQKIKLIFQRDKFSIKRNIA